MTLKSFIRAVVLGLCVTVAAGSVTPQVAVADMVTVTK